MRRVGDRDESDAALAASRREFGMATWQSPLIFHAPVPGPPEDDAEANPNGPSLEELIARERPPVKMHLTDGALQEHAKRLESTPAEETG